MLWGLWLVAWAIDGLNRGADELWPADFSGLMSPIGPCFVRNGPVASPVLVAGRNDQSGASGWQGQI